MKEQRQVLGIAQSDGLISWVLARSPGNLLRWRVLFGMDSSWWRRAQELHFDYEADLVSDIRDLVEDFGGFDLVTSERMMLPLHWPHRWVPLRVSSSESLPAGTTSPEYARGGTSAAAMGLMASVDYRCREAWPVLGEAAEMVVSALRDATATKGFPRPSLSLGPQTVLTAEQISSHLGIDRSTFYRRMAPRLRGIRIGRCVRYRWLDVERWLAGQQQEVLPRAPQPTAKPSTGVAHLLRRHGITG